MGGKSRSPATRSVGAEQIDTRRRSSRGNKGSAGAGGNDGTCTTGVWAVADVRDPDFGKAFTDDKALRSGIRSGDHMLVEGNGGTVVLRWTEGSLDDFVAEYRTSWKPERSSWMNAGSWNRAPLAPLRDRRTSEQRAELSHWDLVNMRGDLVSRRILYGVVAMFAYGCFFYLTYHDEPASALVPLVVTLGYPIVLHLTARVMRDRAPPSSYVFELLLAFDLFQVVTSAIIFPLVILEASRLGMLLPPVGHSSSVSSPLLRQLIWCHYHNRIVELLDTMFRMSQKKFRAYGAFHVGLRLINVWSWWAAQTVGGGDVWFITAMDAMVVSVRFAIFTLSILRWNWNIKIDFGLYAPKVSLFKKEHLLQLQLVEFLVLLVHAVLCLAWGNMPILISVMQIFVMLTGMLIFTDFFFSKNTKSNENKYTDSRLIFSFDSSAWLFIYHFGVAMWMEDNLVLRQPEVLGFSGSSGGALVACTLSTGIDAEKLARHVVMTDWPIAGRNPFRLLHQCELALDQFLPRDAHETSSSVLRVLLTKVSRRPPFLMGEVVSQFSSWEELFSVLRASCHIPIAGGLLPYPIKDHGWFWDGLLWSSLFVPWRTFGRHDSVFKISPFASWADIRPSTILPPWWAMFPPSIECLLGMLMLGYKDAEDWSNRLEKGDDKRWELVRGLMKPKGARKSRMDQEAKRLVIALHASAAWHWKVFSVLVSALVLVLAVLMHTSALGTIVPLFGGVGAWGR